MKKTIVLFLLSLFLQNLSAQKNFHYGANIAAVQTVRSISNQFTNGSLGFSVGASVLYDLSPKFQLQSGVHLLNKRYKDVQGWSYFVRYQAYYLEIPLNLRMKLGKRNILSLGSFLGKPIAYKKDYISRESYPTPTYHTQLSELSAWDTGIYSAYNYRFYGTKRGFIEAGANAQISLTPFWHKTRSFHQQKIHAFSLQLSYFFK
jgi:hypothetical protein